MRIPLRQYFWSVNMKIASGTIDSRDPVSTRVFMSRAVCACWSHE